MSTDTTSTSSKRLATGRDVMKQLCDMMGLSVLPETEAILGEKLDMLFDDSWPELETLREHVKQRSKAMFAYLKHRANEKHKKALAELRSGDNHPMFEADRVLAEEALRRRNEKLNSHETEKNKSTEDVEAPLPGMPSAMEVAEQAKATGFRGKARLSAAERSKLMEDRRNVFYEWKEQGQYDEMSWEEMTECVRIFTETYVQARAQTSEDTSDATLRARIENENDDIKRRAQRLPVLYKLCTSRTSGPDVFKGIKMVIAAKRAIQTGQAREEDVKPQLYLHLAEMYKQAKAVDKHESDADSVRLSSVHEALALGPEGIEAMRMGAKPQLVTAPAPHMQK